MDLKRQSKFTRIHKKTRSDTILLSPIFKEQPAEKEPEWEELHLQNSFPCKELTLGHYSTELGCKSQVLKCGEEFLEQGVFSIILDIKHSDSPKTPGFW